MADVRKRVALGIVISVAAIVSIPILFVLIVFAFPSGEAKLVDLPSVKGPAVVEAAMRKHGIILDVRGFANSSTRAFHAPATWTMAYGYDCKAFGYSHPGVLSISVVGSASSQSMTTNGYEGRGAQREHVGHRAYLHITSNCQWRVWALMP